MSTESEIERMAEAQRILNERVRNVSVRKEARREAIAMAMAEGIPYETILGEIATLPYDREEGDPLLLTFYATQDLLSYAQGMASGIVLAAKLLRTFGQEDMHRSRVDSLTERARILAKNADDTWRRKLGEGVPNEPTYEASLGTDQIIAHAMQIGTTITLCQKMSHEVYGDEELFFRVPGDEAKVNCGRCLAAIAFINEAERKKKLMEGNALENISPIEAVEAAAKEMETGDAAALDLVSRPHISEGKRLSAGRTKHGAWYMQDVTFCGQEFAELGEGAAALYIREGVPAHAILDTLNCDACIKALGLKRQP